MHELTFHQQVHAYRLGHELLASTVKLARPEQDVIDRLSDLAGPIGPGEKFDPYLTVYPLPSALHYVVARTWQDLAAPRAGCVVTRSLLVPADTWASGKHLLPRLVNELDMLGAIDLRAETVSVQTTGEATMPTLTGSVTLELVEALFLEARQPIAVFAAELAETMAIRLLEALWPALRATFSLCTHAYSPRSLAGRPFDLLFAPVSARSNYASWQGRKIDGTSGQRARHRWTAALAHRIFEEQSPQPLLAPFGRVTADTPEADESTLRLFLLWKELEEKSSTSPLAVLGMLDILASQRGEGEKLADSLVPILRRSLSLAASTLGATELFGYLEALLGKFPRRLPPTGVLRSVRDHTAGVAATDAPHAIEFLRQQAEGGSPLPAVMAAGIGDGLAKARRVSEHADALLLLDREHLLLLIGYSRRFAASLIEHFEVKRDPQAFHRLAEVVSTQDATLRARARRNLLPTFGSALEAPVLSALLVVSKPVTIANTVQTLWKANELSVPEFDAVLRSAANDKANLDSLRDALGRLPASDSTDRAMVSTLTVNGDDIDWVQRCGVDPLRQSRWLDELVRPAPDWQLRGLSVSSADDLLRALERGMPATASCIAKVITSANVALTRLLPLVQRVMPYLDEQEATRLVVLSLAKALGDASEAEEADIHRFFATFAMRVPPRDLAIMLAGSKSSVEQVSFNIRLASEAPASARNHVMSRIDELTDQLIARRGDVPVVDAVSKWAALIAGAGDVNPDAQLRAASAALTFALRLPQLDVSALVLTCFPIVYRELQQSRETPSFLSVFSFVDWDRCKTARHDLVNAFIGSVWPPSDLLIAADAVQELPAVLRFLRDRQRGRQYLRLMAKDNPRLPPHVLQLLQSEV